MSEPVRQLTDLIQIRLAWKDRFEGKTLPVLKEHSVYPEPGYPCGRKGNLLASLWDLLAKPTTDGMIINDGDVVIDPHDYNALILYAASDPEAVWTAPVKLWPSATTLPEWVWAHRKMVPLDRPVEEIVRDWQQDISDPEMFSFCFTYLPRRLMEGAIKAGLKERMYPRVDWFMWDTAKELGIPVKVVRECYPKHLNY